MRPVKMSKAGGAEHLQQTDTMIKTATNTIARIK